MKHLNDHILTESDTHIRVTSNSLHDYRIRVVSGTTEAGDDIVKETINIPFQKGNIQDNGVNGITNEALLTVVADRLRQLQQGDFPCRENHQALERVEEALNWLHARTRRRLVSGIEGTNVSETHDVEIDVDLARNQQVNMIFLAMQQANLSPEALTGSLLYLDHIYQVVANGQVVELENDPTNKFVQRGKDKGRAWLVFNKETGNFSATKKTKLRVKARLAIKKTS